MLMIKKLPTLPAHVDDQETIDAGVDDTLLQYVVPYTRKDNHTAGQPRVFSTSMVLMKRDMHCLGKNSPMHVE